MSRGLKIIILTLLVIAAVVGISFFWPEITAEKPSQRLKEAQERFPQGIQDVLGEKTEEIVETVERKITQEFVSRSGQEITEILKSLPPEQQKAVKKEFCPPK